LKFLVSFGPGSKRGLPTASRLSLLTWQALSYYAYTDCVSFKPLGSKDVESSVGHSPSDPRFRGCPCSMKELYELASLLPFLELRRLVTTELLSSITSENAIEEMFSGFPLPTTVIVRGAEIIRDSGSLSKRHIHSQLREMLAGAADGSRLGDRDAVLGCLSVLLRHLADG